MLSRRQFVLGAVAVPALAQKKPPERPNVVLILAEGLPAFAIGVYGNKEIRTPRIDRLAQMGTRFLNHFAAAPVPGVNRGTLLTGRTPMQLGEAEVSLDKILGAQGYSTNVTDAAGAVSFLNAPPAGKPFFLTVNLKLSQPPYDGVAQKYHALYAQTSFNTMSPERTAAMADAVPMLRKAAAAISAVDEELQTVIAKIHERKLLDQMLLIFTSTSGDMLSHHGLWGAGDASMYEEAVRTPMIWVRPGLVPPQLSRPELVSAYDLIPSLCDTLSIDPPSRNLCGRSYMLMATGKPLPRKEPWRATVFAHYRNTGMARVQRHKLVLRDQGRSELYALNVDPAEKVNQYDNPEFVTVRNSLTAELNAWKQRFGS